MNVACSKEQVQRGLSRDTGVEHHSTAGLSSEWSGSAGGFRMFMVQLPMMDLGRARHWTGLVSTFLRSNSGPLNKQDPTSLPVGSREARLACWGPTLLLPFTPAPTPASQGGAATFSCYLWNIKGTKIFDAEPPKLLSIAGASPKASETLSSAGSSPSGGR